MRKFCEEAKDIFYTQVKEIVREDIRDEVIDNVTEEVKKEIAP